MPPLPRPQRATRRVVPAALATGLGGVVLASTVPGHAARVENAFAPLDETEKRSLAEICRKLAA